MNSKQIYHAHGLYQCGMSLSKVGKRIGIKRQSLHYYFKVLGLATRPLKKSKTLLYNHQNYTVSKEGYWRKTTGDRESLHRQIFKDNHGEIPKGFEVAFKDGDNSNLDPDNLEIITTIEAVSNRGFINNQHTVKKERKC